MKYIDAELLRKEIEFAWSVYNNPHRVVHGIADAFRQDGRAAMCEDILKKMDSLQQEPDKNLEEAAEKYRRASCNAAMKPNIDGPIPEYGGNVKTAFIAGAQWMKEQMMNDVVEGTLAGQLLSSLTENGKQMVITVPRNKFPSNPKTKSIKLIIVKEN